jgi:two-component system response regulator HydG
MNPRVLVVDDEQSMCELLDTALTPRGFSIVWRTSAEAAFREFERQPFDVVLTDLRMKGTDGIELCQRMVGNRPDVPVVVMTAFGSLETAVSAIRAGAYDFVTKPMELDVLALTLRRAARHRELQEQVRVLSAAVERAERSGFGKLLGESPVMQRLYDQMDRIADSEAPVLLTGESGCGKELVARSLHALSRRKQRPFVAVNCAALPETLLESELFGHARGAFTDARGDRKGLFVQADGGTLFLDEIAKLLRALEENKVRPLGGEREESFDVRLLSATNRDLESAVEAGSFREDLYYRIQVIPIEVPPLRARGTDILLLARHFLEYFADRAQKTVTGISNPTAEKLLAYNWPGNVRELRNVIQRAVALTRYDKLGADDLPEKVRDYRRAQVVIAGEDPSELLPLDEVERRYIQHVLETVDGNKTLAARILGLDRKTLYRKLRQAEPS